MNRRVVITGVGLVTPLGIGVQESWRALCAGKSGVGEITRFDTSKFQTKIAAQVKGFQAEDYLPKKEAKRTERFIAYAVAASRMALEDSGLVIDDTNAERVGVITGCGLGGLSILEDWISSLVYDRHMWPEEYLKHLMNIIGTIGKHGRAVVVGRGANFILPPEQTLPVYL